MSPRKAPAPAVAEAAPALLVVRVAQWRYAVPSQSQPRTWHYVWKALGCSELTPGGSWRCDCRASFYRGRCAHVTAVVGAQLLGRVMPLPQWPEDEGDHG